MSNEFTTEVDELARTLFDFEHVDDELRQADVIIGFGSHDIHVAQRAAELARKGLAPYLLFTGGFGRITQRLWNEPEAVRFARVAEESGAKPERILVEDKASNTGENISLSKQLLESRGLPYDSIIFVDRPYRGRRTKAALEVQWPGKSHYIASPQMDYEDYAAYYSGANAPISKNEFISLMVGDIQRNIEYGKRGFQTPMEIPDEVMGAYRKLIGLGFTRHLMKG